MFRESKPYHTQPWDLDLLLEEFSSVTEGDSREGENEEVDERKVIVGTIPCPMDRPETQREIHQDNGGMDVRNVTMKVNR